MGETTTNNDLLKKIAATVTEPHHHITVTYEEDSDIEVDGVAISVVPLVDFFTDNVRFLRPQPYEPHDS